MCVAGTGCTVRGHGREHAPRPPTVNRRTVLGGAVGAALVTLVPAQPALARHTRGPSRRRLDLTHTFEEAMPTYGDEKPTREVISPMAPPGEFGFYNQRWTFTEHVGTHMDAPGHVIGGGRLTPDIRPEELVAPAAVIDITDKAAHDPNAVVTVRDVVASERRHGRIPDGAAVLMHSGWAERWDQGDLAYRGTTDPEEFPFNFPGFSPDACDFLIRRRAVVGVGVDTLSTDPGNSTDFPAHEVLGRADRWGLENLANLAHMPPRGMTVAVGLVPWDQGSGGPCRVVAFS